MEPTFEEQIELMNKSFEGDSATTTTPPGTSAPGTVAPNTETPLEPATSAPNTEAPATTVPATTAPVTEVPDDRDQQISDLLAENERLKAEQTKPTTTVPATAAPEIVEPLNFVTEEEFDDAQSDFAKFNALLGKVYERATADVEKKFASRFETLPQTVSEQIKMREDMLKIRTDFYSANPDLEKFQEVVGVVFEQFQRAEPDKPYQDLLARTGPEVRKRLKLPPLEAPKADDPPTPPKLPNRKGRSGQVNNNQPSNDMASQIAEMNKSLEK